MTDKPLLLIDVDGPLNPWAATNSKRPKMYRRYRIDGYVVWLARQHGEELNKLTDVFDLVWCTTWEHQANTDIGPKIGLPKLPVIEFKRLLEKFPVPPEPGLHWKTAAITAYAIAHERPFCWVDDEVDAKDGIYFARWQPNPFLTKKIDPAVGLTNDDFAELREWAEGGMHDLEA
jgi:hypothetical protein